jgi:hypothetical protein
MAAPSSYGSKAKSAVSFAKKATPVVMELYRRWQSLPPEQRERYLKTAREYIDRAATAAQEARAKRTQAGSRRR